MLRDRALALPPLNATLARRLIAETRIHAALRGVRGRPPVDLDLLAALLVRFSDLSSSSPASARSTSTRCWRAPTASWRWTRASCSPTRQLSDAELPRTAIRPYPTEYVCRSALRDGTPIVVRPIRPEDEPLMVAFHATLSEDSVRMRYMQGMKLDQRTAHERLVRVCFNDYDREIALVVERTAATGEREILGLGRLSKDRAARAGAGGADAEFSLLVGDPWQGKGVGHELLSRLVDIGGRERMTRIYADILSSNLRMQRLCTRLGFTIDDSPDEGVVRAEHRL